MARNRNKIGSLSHQVQSALDNKLAIGESKYQSKIDGTMKDKIFSWETYRSYMKHLNYFVKYCKDQHEVKTLAECKPYMNEWLQTRIDQGVSPYTQKLESAALVKLYDLSPKDLIKTQTRHRANISRSRGEKVRDSHFSEKKNKDLVEFCKSTGLRRAELQALTGDKLIQKGNQLYIKVNSGSKGGRYREAPVIHNMDLVKNHMTAAGSDKVFNKISNGADIHGYRSAYATELYNSLARPIEQIPFDKVNKGTGRAYQSQVYHCRGDLKGVCYDKVAMQQVSEALGHDRISVIAEHYIRG